MTPISLPLKHFNHKQLTHPTRQLGIHVNETIDNLNVRFDAINHLLKKIEELKKETETLKQKINELSQNRES